MKVLIQSTYYATPHFETELEIALDHLNAGDEVYFLAGISKFKISYGNPNKNWLVDQIASSIYRRGIKYLKRRSNENAVNVVSYPEVKIDYQIPEFGSVEELKQVQYKGFDIGLAVASSLISFLRDHRFDTLKNRLYINRSFETALFVYESTKLLLEQIRPDKVILFNGRFIENRPLIRLCEEANIPFATHERGGVLGNYLLRDNSIPHSIETAHAEIDELWSSANGEKEKIGQSFFVDRRNRIIQGWYSFTSKQRLGLLPQGFDCGSKNIVIFNSSMDEYEGIAEFKHPIYRDENEGIQRICESLLSYPEYKIFLRVHPNLGGLRNTQMVEISSMASKYKNLFLIDPEDVVDSYALMERADKVLVLGGSTMGIEAAYWKKPTILAGRAFYEELGCIYKPQNHSELLKLLTNYNLPWLENLDPLKYGYWELMKGKKYKYFHQTSLTTGKFLSKTIKPNVLLNSIWKSALKIKTTIKSTF